jgi:hypothetical protein
MCGGGGGGGGMSREEREAQEAAAERRHQENLDFQREQARLAREEREADRARDDKRYEEMMAQQQSEVGGGGAPPANPVAMVSPVAKTVIAPAATTRMPNATADPFYNSSQGPEALAIAPRRLQAGSGRRRFRNPVNSPAGGSGGLNIPG